MMYIWTTFVALKGYQTYVAILVNPKTQHISNKMNNILHKYYIEFD